MKRGRGLGAAASDEVHPSQKYMLAPLVKIFAVHLDLIVWVSPFLIKKRLILLYSIHKAIGKTISITPSKGDQGKSRISGGNS